MLIFLYLQPNRPHIRWAFTLSRLSKRTDENARFVNVITLKKFPQETWRRTLNGGVKVFFY